VSVDTKANYTDKRILNKQFDDAHNKSNSRISTNTRSSEHWKSVSKVTNKSKFLLQN